MIVKGGINTRVSARYEFGLGALSSHAASQSPSTIRGVPAVWEGDIITALNVGWVSPMGAIFSLSEETYFRIDCTCVLFLNVINACFEGKEYIKI